MSKAYKITNIDYCVDSDEDVEGFSEEEVKNLLDELPKEIIVKVSKEDLKDNSLEEILTEAISNQTGWLVYGFDYERFKKVKT